MRFRQRSGLFAAVVATALAACTSSDSPRGAPTPGAAGVADCGALTHSTKVNAPGIGGEYYLRSALPVGACSDGSACHLDAVAECSCGGYGGTLIYDCNCASGTWSCALVGQGATACGCLLHDGGAGSEGGAGGAPIEDGGGGSDAGADGAPSDDGGDDGGSVSMTLPVCKPGLAPSVVLTPDGPNHQAEAVMADDNAIYVGIGTLNVSNEASVIALRSDGSGSTKLYGTPGPFQIRGLALAGGSVFVSAGSGAGGRLLALPVGGGAPVGAPTIGDGVPWIASGGDRVYYWQWGTDVLSAGADGAPGPTLHTSLHDPAAGVVDRLAVAGDDVFVQVASFQSPTFTLERGSTAGGDTVVIATVTQPLALAADGTSVFWSEAGDPAHAVAATVKRAARDGSSIEVLAELRATSLAADGTRLFLTTADGVVQIDLASKTATTIAAAQSAPSAISQRGARVYWVNDAPGSGGTGVQNAVMTGCKQ